MSRGKNKRKAAMARKWFWRWYKMNTHVVYVQKFTPLTEEELVQLDRWERERYGTGFFSQ